MGILETALGRVELRELSGLEELAAAEPLQVAVWGKDTLPESRELLLAVQHAGGLVAGAFAFTEKPATSLVAGAFAFTEKPATSLVAGAFAFTEKPATSLVAGAFDPSSALVGLIFSFPTRDPALQHSHRLAVLPGWRGQGLGAALKWFQRDWCLERGVSRVEWTVDPLRMPNAELNAGLLGAEASTYLLDYYGAMQGIDAGLPSDRLLMEWRLDSPRVQALANENIRTFDASWRQKYSNMGNSETRPVNRVVDGRPCDPCPELDAPRLSLAIPPDFSALARGDPGLALEWRLHARLLFQALFARGYSVCGFTRSGGPAYLLERTS